jgi:rare lipoprotein A
MKSRLLTGFFLCLGVVLFSCTTTRITGPITPEKPAVSPKATRVAETFEGTASWYGPEFHGKKTASGEIFDMTDLTAAHKTLPLGTTCIVTNKRNNKSVTVRINDRGPFAKERIIDLSYAAAKVIGMIDTGTAPVRVEVLAEEGEPIIESAPIEDSPVTGPPAETPPTETAVLAPGPAGVTYTVQVGSFSSKANAQTLSDALSEKHRDVTIEEFSTTETTYWRVRVGKFATRKEAEAKAEELTGAGYTVFITER